MAWRFFISEKGLAVLSNAMPRPTFVVFWAAKKIEKKEVKIK